MTLNLGRTILPERKFALAIYTIYTDYIYGLLQTGEKLINRKDIAEALLKRGVLRQVQTIQISNNIKFVSIEFDTTSTMETFCQEPLTLQDNFQAIFLPDFQRKPRRV